MPLNKIAPALALLILGSTACTTFADTTPQSRPGFFPAEQAPMDRFVSLVAEGSVTGIHLSISVPTVLSEAAAEATLSQNAETWRVDEANCEAFKTAIMQFRELPSIRPGDQYLQTDSRAPRPMAPSRRDGESWVITTRGYTPDWSSVDLEIRGAQGPYAGWVNNMVDVIKNSCGAGTK